LSSTTLTGFFLSLAAALTCQGCPLPFSLTASNSTAAAPAPEPRVTNPVPLPSATTPVPLPLPAVTLPPATPQSPTTQPVAPLPSGLPSSSPQISPQPSSSQPTSPQSSSPQSSSPRPTKPKPAAIKPETERFLRLRSRSITVKVLADQTWGSGVLIQRQGQRYLVLTNAHVSQAGKKLQVQTVDGRLYSAKVYPQANFQGKDLALLEFESSSSYTIASLGRAADLKSGSMVFASGFPLQPQGAERDGFFFTQGQVSMVTPKSFEGGYRIGYLNPVVKGMSGGPVLNSNGVLVAVNGMHAYPLWGNPYVFEDGTTPPANQQNLLIRSSWGIPVETFLTLAPKSLEFARPLPTQPAAGAPIVPLPAVVRPLSPSRAPQPKPTLPASIR
jgi:serine protease Do